MQVKVTRRAAEFIIDRGGAVYLSIAPFGQSAVLQASTERTPAERDFELVDQLGGCSVYASPELAELRVMETTITVRIGLFPRRHLVALLPGHGEATG